MKFTTTTNTLCAPFDIQRSKVQVVDIQLDNIDYTYSTNFFALM